MSNNMGKRLPILPAHTEKHNSGVWVLLLLLLLITTVANKHGFLSARAIACGHALQFSALS